jgi:hypothetical protein
MKQYSDEEIYNKCFKYMDLEHNKFKKIVEKKKYILIEDVEDLIRQHLSFPHNNNNSDIQYFGLELLKELNFD